jgi:hypothetical protein
MLINEANSFSFYKKKGKLIDNKFEFNEDLERTIYQLHLEYDKEKDTCMRNKMKNVFSKGICYLLIYSHRFARHFNPIKNGQF